MPGREVAAGASPRPTGYYGGCGIPSSAPVCALGHHCPEGKALREIATPVCELARNDREKSVAGCAEFGAVERGASDEQALAMGMLSGAFEMLFEKYELENLLGGDTNALKAFANQALTEGIGEGATSLANTAADILVMAEKSDLSAAVAEYQKRGFSSRDARKQALLDTAIQIGWDFVGGMAMGGIMGASSAEIKKLTQKPEQKESGGQGFEKYIQALEKAGMLPDKAGSAAVGSVERKLEQDVKADEFYPNHSERQKNTTENGSMKYSLRTFEDNTRFVDVQMDTNIFDGLSVSEMNRKAKTILMDKFAGKVIGIDNKVFVNGDSVNEYLHPSKSIDLDIRKAKLAAAGELDNLLDAGKQLPNEPDGKDGHIHPDAIDFSYYKTIFKVGSEFFEGVVNVKNIKRGKLLKDVTKIRNITEDIVSSYGQNPKSNFLRDASMDSIRSIDKKVKSNAPEKSSVAPQQLGVFRKYAEEAGLQLEAVQETALQTMEKLSAILGVKFYIYQSYGRDGKRYYMDESGREKAAPNGKYYADGRIYVDLNAGDGGKGTMLYTVSHELTHFIRQWSRAKYEVLADFLVEQYGRAGLRADNLVVEQMAKARRQGRKLSWEEAHEEMVADSMEAMLTDGNVVRTMAELKRQDKTLWQKICRWFRNLAEDLKAVVKAYKGHKPDSAEGKMVAGMRDVIGKLESLYADALMDAGENFQAASDEQNSAALEVDPRYSIREGMTDQERYDDLKKKRITVISDSRISEYADDIASLEAIQTRAKSKAEKIIKPLAKKLGIINTPLTTADIEIEFLFTARGLTESSHKQLRYGGSYVDFAKTLINLDRVLETAVLIEVHGDKYADTSRANENLEAVYVLLGAFKDNSNIIPVQMEIKRSSDVGGRLYLTVAMTKIEADVVGNALEKDQTPSLLPASEYTLAEIFGKINPKDAHFLKYLPERFLNEQQLKAKKAALEEDARRIAGYGKKDAKEKLADQDSGIKAKADKGFAESVQKHLGSRNVEEALFNAQDRLLSADNFMGWTGEDWTRYFGKISREKGKMAARERLKELASQGLIPNEMLIHASAGTRGGNSRGAYTSSGPSGHLPLRGEGFPSGTQAQQTAQIVDAESYARRLQEVMPELAAENADAGWRRGQKEVTKQEIHNGLEKSGQYDKIAAEIRSVGGFAENAKVHIPSQKSC